MPRPLPPLALLLALAGGCAGELENPERFMAPSTGPTCPDDIDVMADIIGPSCGNGSICHAAGDGGPPSGVVDLVSEGVADRLVGVPSPEGEQCAGYVRVDPDDIENSLLLRKLREDTLDCGSRMPLGAFEEISEEHYACIREWAESLVGSGGGGGDGGTGGGDDAGAGGDDAGSTDGGV